MLPAPTHALVKYPSLGPFLGLSPCLLASRSRTSEKPGTWFPGRNCAPDQVCGVAGDRETEAVGWGHLFLRDEPTVLGSATSPSELRLCPGILEVTTGQRREVGPSSSTVIASGLFCLSLSAGSLHPEESEGEGCGLSLLDPLQGRKTLVSPVSA